MQKWWWNIFTFLLEVTAHNAHRVYTQSAAMQHTKFDHLASRGIIANTYLVKHACDSGETIGTGPWPAPHAAVPDDVRVDGAHHYAASGKIQRHCRICWTNTVRYCVQCSSLGEVVALHDSGKKGCFHAFHCK